MAEVCFPLGEGVEIGVGVFVPATAEVVGVGSGGTDGGGGEDMASRDAVGALLVCRGDGGGEEHAHVDFAHLGGELVTIFC